MPRTADRPTSAIPEGWDQPAPKDRSVEILDILTLLFRHLTPSLCQTVFQEVREDERQRKWSLEAIARFWTAMIVRHPPSLTQGIAQTRKKGSRRDPLWPRVQAEVNAFFEKCWALRPDFFRALYEGFTQSLLRETPEAYARWMMTLREHFPEILVVDGSRLDAVAHRLKLLWPIRTPILPGCVTVFYDLFRGITRRVVFYRTRRKRNCREPRASWTGLPEARWSWGIASIPYPSTSTCSSAWAFTGCPARAAGSRSSGCAS